MGTRFGTELPGPQPPQEYVDDLRGRSPFWEFGSGNVSSRPLIVAWVPTGGSASGTARESCLDTSRQLTVGGGMLVTPGA